jgi:hypothetical protein
MQVGRHPWDVLGGRHRPRTTWQYGGGWYGAGRDRHGSPSRRIRGATAVLR